MKKLILVTGNLAALKSTVSKRLAQDFSIPVFNKDDIKEILGDQIGYQNREENLKLSRTTFALMMYMVKQVLVSKASAIIESNFRKEELIVIFDYCRMLNIKTCTLFLTADDKTLYDRYLNRYPNRHHVHNSTGQLSLEIIAKTMKTYNAEDYIGESYLYDTTNFDEHQYTSIVQDVKEFLKS